LTRIRLEDVYFRYPRGEDWVLSGINFTPEEKGLTALIGPNGSGKTTLGKLMTGILQPTEGRVLIEGQDSGGLSLGAIGKRIGYLFQNPERQIFAPTVEEELSFALRLKGVPDEEINSRVEEMLGRFRLTDLQERFPFNLSRGEKQRLALAATLINRPDYLILDEPTTALDIKRKNELLGFLKELLDRGVGMLIISHDHDFLKKHASEMVEMAGGEIQ